MKQLPEISVIMGVYNQRSDTTMLQRAVQSILGQSYGDFEFLICDDGSCEAVTSALDEFASGDPRIRLLRGGGKYTLPQKLNYCLRFAKGRYIARMDDDDYSFPERFELQMKLLSENPEISFIGSNVNLIRNGKLIGERILPAFPKKEDFLFVQPYIHPTLIFRREALDIVGGYSEKRWQLLCEDFDLLLRMYEKGLIGCNVQKTLFDYTLPPIGRSKRKFQHRLNEAVTRWERFQSLNMLPAALPYVVKPLIVGLIPEKILERMKERHYSKNNNHESRNE